VHVGVGAEHFSHFNPGLKCPIRPSASGLLRQDQPSGEAREIAETRRNHKVP
jgi:hypothetical protein